MSSTPEILERGVMTTDDLLLRLFGRSFGSVMEDATRFEQPLPDFFEPVVNDLHSASAILKLDDGATEDQIFDAYKQDIRFLQGRLDQLESWVRACIRVSVKRTTMDYDSARDERIKRGWKFVQQHIPPIAHAPLIDLPAERAALPAPQLLAELKREVDPGIDRMMKRFCLWLDLLVSREYVGIVHFTGPTVGHYYYFRPFTTEKVEVTNRQDITVDKAVPFGQQTTYTDVEHRKYKITESVERHDHHIVKAKVDTLADYTGRIPDRIVDGLNTAPQWLRPHLRIVSGDITKEVVRQRIVREHEEVHERVTSVYKGSPAVALGSYAINGWSSDDLQREPSGYFGGQKVYSLASRADFRRGVRITATLVIVAALAISGIWYLVHRDNLRFKAAYDQYYAQVTTGKDIVTLTKDKMITLPRGEPLYFLEKRGYELRVSTDQTTQWRSNVSPNFQGFPQLGNWYTLQPKFDGSSEYGDVDLMEAGLGIPARMHVLYADKEKIQFVLDYYTTAKNIKKK